MTRGKSILGALALCAFALCAFGAVNASAEGMTAVTCEELGEGSNYNTAECATPTQTGKFETVAIELNKTTQVEGTASGISALKGTVALTKVEITCAKTSTINADIKNITVGTDMRVEGKGSIDYSECHASLEANTAKKCEVESVTGTAGVKGTIATNSLKSITSPEHKVTFEPEEGTTFAKFKILKGECLGATAEVTVSGTLTGIAATDKHHHITFTPATNGGNLKANGGAASYEGTYHAVMGGQSKKIGIQTF